MPEAIGKCFDKRGELLFEVHSVGMVAAAIDATKEKLLFEFDHCFDADDWAKITIEINREVKS